MRLGSELRRRRCERQLSQAVVARPFTRSYVSAIENGHVLPSLSALVLLAERLGTTAGEVLDAVNPQLAHVYTRPDGARHSQEQHSR